VRLQGLALFLLLMQFSQLCIASEVASAPLTAELERAVTVAKTHIGDLTQVTQDQIYILRSKCSSRNCEIYIAVNTVPGIFVVRVDATQKKVIEVKKLE